MRNLGMNNLYDEDWLSLRGNLPRELCCKDWNEAHKLGTDNESYGALIGYVESTDVECWEQRKDQLNQPFTGYRLAPIKFCPWCGVKKKAVVCLHKETILNSTTCFGCGELL